MNLRKDTINEINCSIGGLVNIYLDNPNEEPITLESAIDYVYDELIENAENERFGITSAVKFDGKDNIRNFIKQELLKEKDTIKFYGIGERRYEDRTN